ncbi:MAG: hypothetical protein JXR97_07785, partial [Planctomycetes bacterium]|nr:hypothetical protein [Planctomycetota bacterium]
GTVIFVSHEREFCRKVATRVIEVGGGKIANFPGDFEAYLAGIENEQAAPSAAGRESKKEKASPSPEKGRQKYEMEKKAASCERRMEKLEESIADLHSRMMQESDWQKAAQLKEEHDSLLSEKESLETEWLELLEALDE